MRFPLLPLPRTAGPAWPAGLTAPAQVGAAVAVSAAGGLVLAAVGDWRLALALLAAALLVAVGMVRPALLVSAFVLLRPLLDDYSKVTVGGVPSANPGGALGLLLLGGLAVVLGGAPKIFRPRATWPFVAVLAISAAAAAMALTGFGGTIGAKPISELLRLAVLVAIYLLAANLFTTPARVRQLFVLVALSAVLPAANGIYQWIQGVEPLPGYETGRITGTFAGPLPFSAYLAVAAVILIALPREALRAWVRVPALAVILTALVGTYSREGWVIFLLGVVLIHGRRRVGLVVTALVASVVVVAAVPTVRERVLPAESAKTQGAGLESYDWRIGNWSGLLAQWEERPLFGWGLTTTAYVNPRSKVESVGLPGGGHDAHHTGVRLLVEGGIVLLLAYIVLFVVLIGRLYRIQSERWELRPFARVVFWLWAVLLFIGLTTDDPLEETAMMYALLALTGSVEGARHRALEGESGPQAPLSERAER